MLTTEEKRLLMAYKDKIQAAVSNLAGAVPVTDLQKMADIWKREKDAGYRFRAWCNGCKMDLLRKMNLLLNDINQ